MNDVCPCPACGRRLQLPENVIEQEVRCPSCGEVFKARPEGPPAAPAAGGFQSEPSVARAPGREDRYGDEPRTPTWERPREGWDDLDDWRPRLPEALPGAGLSTTLVVLLALNVAMGFVTLAVDAISLNNPPKQLGAGQAPDLDPLVAFGCLAGLVYLGTAVVFCTWMYRSYANLRELGVRGLRYSPAWAAGAFFVPILNLWRPCQIAQEMWRASSPQLDEEDGPRWQRTSGSGIVGGWWTFWLLSNFVNQVAVRAALAEGREAFEIGAVAGALGGGLSCLAALFAIFMIRGLRRRQEQKLEELLDRW